MISSCSFFFPLVQEWWYRERRQLREEKEKAYDKISGLKRTWCPHICSLPDWTITYVFVLCVCLSMHVHVCIKCVIQYLIAGLWTFCSLIIEQPLMSHLLVSSETSKHFYTHIIFSHVHIGINVLFWFFRKFYYLICWFQHCLLDGKKAIQLMVYDTISSKIKFEMLFSLEILKTFNSVKGCIKRFKVFLSKTWTLWNLFYF